MRQISLEDRYTLTSGRVVLSGMQALVRGLIEQARRDREAGLVSGTLVSGYPGSPLAGLDTALTRARPQLDPLAIHHVPAVNEELGAAAVMGSQMLDLFPHPAVDATTGVWYGKAPGLDRAGDAMRHGNLAGTPRFCGAVALCGDDPGAKSSTLPTQSEYAFLSAGMPVLYPGTVAELMTHVIHAINLSRFAGLWVGVKLVTDLCDGGASVEVSPQQPTVTLPEVEVDGEPFRRSHSYLFVPPWPLRLEQELFEHRLVAARAYGRANGLDRIDGPATGARIGVVAAGKTATDLRQALADLGLDATERERLGVRILEVGMIHPLDADTVRGFAHGLEEVVVVEEKRGFLEAQLKEALYGQPGAPRVVGKHDRDGHRLFPVHGELDADLIASRLGPLLAGDGHPGVTARLEQLQRARTRETVSLPLRPPNYCSGCPHSRSTLAVDGMSAGGGIGCHGMASIIDQEERRALFLVPMGAEGATWIGTAPFTSREHFVQNVGDGTFFHSASQAVRAAVAAGVDMTVRILHNSAVAMTGGQDAAGAKDVPALTRLLEAEGVARTIVVAEEPERYRRVAHRLAENSTVRGRDGYDEAMRELARTRGVTALVYDQRCAAEKRRLRKRGRLAEPRRHVVIDPDVCEGCGHCGEISNCASVQPVMTEFGDKTQVELSSCNADYACADGDCPSFLVVHSRSGYRPRRDHTALPPGLDALPEPAARRELGGVFRLHLSGVGGTGVVTINQMLAHAALMEGRHALTLDQTGLAQKGGAVVSNLVIGDEPLSDASNRIGTAAADTVLALDPLSASSPVNLVRCDPGRTRVAGNAHLVPTGSMVRGSSQGPPSRGSREVEPVALSAQAALERHSRSSVWVDAHALAQRWFGDHMAANVIVLGAAWQAGMLPLEAASIEAAIRLNGVAVDQTLAAFRIGRLAVADEDRLAPGDRAAAVGGPNGAGLDERDRAVGQLRAHRRAGYEALLEHCDGLDDESRRLLEIRLARLVAYQDVSYATRYLDRVLAVQAKEVEVLPGRHELTHAAIRHLYKLMAYKDEYEVARLLLASRWREQVEGSFDRPRIRYLLHPPFLRALGLERKLELGGWVRPILAVLAAGRRLRATPLDLFGRSRVRREERALIRWYEQLLDEVTSVLTPDNHEVAVELASVPDVIRGYEQIKLDRAARARRTVEERRSELVGAFAQPPPR